MSMNPYIYQDYKTCGKLYQFLLSNLLNKASFPDGVEKKSPGQKTQTSEYNINKLCHFAAKDMQDAFFLCCLDLSLDFFL